MIFEILIILIEELIKLFNLESLWMNDIRKEQTLYRQKSGHILNKYNPDNWKEDYLW